MNEPLALSLLISVPLAGAVLIACAHRYPNVRETITLVTAALLFALVIRLLPAVQAGGRPAAVLLEVVPGLSLALEAEPLGMLFGLVSSFLWIVTSIYSIGYMRVHQEAHQTRFYVCFAIALASAMGVAFAANMFTLFLFYEALTLSTYPLVTHAGTEEARRAGRLYLGTLLGTSIGLQLVAIVWTWAVAGTLDFTEGGVLGGRLSDGALAALLALYVFGIGKAALMPFHRWLPAAMVAPTPVSALLHAVAVVKAGVFTIVKIVLYLFGLETLRAAGAIQWLLYLAALTIVLGSLVALRTDNLKARLAYSTVSQLSYVVLGALLANRWGVVGAGMHIVMHAFGKITLFFCAGAILVAAHKTEVSEMRGLGRAMPLTMLAFAIGSLSVIGVPPLGGTWSKWFLVLGALEREQLVLVAVLLVSTLLNIAYLLPIPLRAFFGREAALAGGSDSSAGSGSGVREAPVACLIALAISSLGCVALFFYPQAAFELLMQVVRDGL